MAHSSDILVVGAGPVGLAMALELHRHGSPCRIIEQATAAHQQSRASDIHARTLEAFLHETEPARLDAGMMREVVLGRDPKTATVLERLKAEHPALNNSEIANICYVFSGRKPDVRSVGNILDETPIPLKTFRRFDPGQGFLLPPSLDDWLPREHLARFIAELVDEHLDLSRIYAGSCPFLHSR